MQTWLMNIRGSRRLGAELMPWKPSPYQKQAKLGASGSGL
jgi:hypothetical protein